MSSISSVLEFWFVNHTSIGENPESNIFKDIKFSGELYNNWPKDGDGTWHKCMQYSWVFLIIIISNIQCINTTSVISKRGLFSPFCFLLSYS